jgi:hypothetical protein
VQLLGGLETEYDIAVRLGVQNIPEFFRQIAVDQIKLGVEGGLQQGPDESDEEYDARVKMTNQQMDQMVSMINDINELTVGLKIDEPAKQAYLDLGMTVVPGSKTAKQMEASQDKPSQYAGFLFPDAVASLHINSSSDPSSADTAQMTTAFQTLRRQVESEIDNEADLGDEQVKAIVKQLVGEVMDVVEATLKTGRFNGGAAIVGKGPFTVVGGGYVADGSKLEDVIKKVVDLGQNEPDFPEVKMNAAEYKGVRFHTASVVVPPEAGDHGEMVSKLVGSPVSVVLGFGEETFFVAVGPEALDTIKQVIDKSATTDTSGLPPMQLNVALAPILNFVATLEDTPDPMLAKVAAAIKDSAGKDHVSLTVTEISGGMRYRLLAEEGVLKAVSMAASAQAAQGGLGGF